MELKVNDLVVVPGFGVGCVEARDALDVGKSDVEVFRIDLGPDNGRYFVPVDRVEAEGLRPPMDVEVADATWDVIAAQKAPKKRANWNRRRKRYHEMVQSNEPTKLAELIGELAAVRRKKRKKKQTLSFGERTLFQKVRDLLVGEIAAATGKARDAVEARFDQVIEGPAQQQAA